MIKKRKLTLMQRSTMDSFSADVNVNMRRHKISLAVNYRLYSHGDVSYRFNGKNDNVVLELVIIFKLVNENENQMFWTNSLLQRLLLEKNVG